MKGKISLYRFILITALLSTKIFYVVLSFIHVTYPIRFQVKKRQYIDSLQLPITSSSFSSFHRPSLFMVMNKNENNDIILVKDTSSLIELFTKTCDPYTQRMTKEQFKSIPIIGDMLKNQDLSLDELNTLWKQIVSSDSSSLDQDLFLKLYRIIDNLFEDDEVIVDEEEEEDDDEEDKNKEDEEEEVVNLNNSSSLEITFRNLCDDHDDDVSVVVPLISRSSLVAWIEIQNLFQEKLLNEEEFDSLWSQSLFIQSQISSSNTTTFLKKEDIDNKLTFQGFQSFNNLLDDLFILEEEEEEEEESKEMGFTKTKEEIVVYYNSEKKQNNNNTPPSPELLFAQIAMDQKTLSLDSIQKRWGDLQDMLQDGDLSKEEVVELFQRASSTTDHVDCNGFVIFYDLIHSLFEDVEEDKDKAVIQQSPQFISSKTNLLNLISDIEKDTNKLPCGLESTEEEILQIASIVKDVERESSNILLSKKGSIQASDVAGTWTLVYTSSSALKFNKGISGLVPPTGKFGGLTQKLKASKFMLDLEYIEKVNAGPGSFEVRVTGDWEIKSSVSLFTGEQAIALKVVPNIVLYGITTQKADHWKSLGPMNLLDISYLDDDLRIMRGTTSSENIFIFRKT